MSKMGKKVEKSRVAYGQTFDLISPQVAFYLQATNPLSNYTIEQALAKAGR